MGTGRLPCPTGLRNIGAITMNYYSWISASQYMVFTYYTFCIVLCVYTYKGGHKVFYYMFPHTLLLLHLLHSSSTMCISIRKDCTQYFYQVLPVYGTMLRMGGVGSTSMISLPFGCFFKYPNMRVIVRKCPSRAANWQRDNEDTVYAMSNLPRVIIQLAHPIRERYLDNFSGLGRVSTTFHKIQIPSFRSCV